MGVFTTPFDTSRSYRFIANGQRGSPSSRGSYFTNITLSSDVTVPTLSEWGMIILSLILAGLAYRKFKTMPVKGAAASS